MDIGEALDRVGKGLLIDLRVFRPDPVADGAIGDRRRIRGSCLRSNIGKTVLVLP